MSTGVGGQAQEDFSEDTINGGKDFGSSSGVVETKTISSTTTASVGAGDTVVGVTEEQSDMNGGGGQGAGDGSGDHLGMQVDDPMGMNIGMGGGGNGDAMDHGTGSYNDTGSADHSGKDDDRKLFIGGLSWETTEKDLREYFSKYGAIESLTLKTDPATGRSRGFAFIVFSDGPTLDKVVAAGEHLINGKKIDPKKAKARNGKVFVGGLSQEISDEEVKAYFSQFGKVTEIEMPIDKIKNQRKGFCFVTFENEQVVHELLKTPKQRICGKEVDVKKAQPSQNQRGAGWGGMGMGGRGGRGAPRGRGGGRGGRGDWSGAYGSMYGTGYPSYGTSGYTGYDYYGGGYGAAYSYDGYGTYGGGGGGGTSYDSYYDYDTTGTSGSSSRGSTRGRGGLV